MGIFDAKGIDFNNLELEEFRQTSSSYGKGFAASGGVANAVVNVLNSIDPDREVKTVKAEGLAECKKMLMLAKAGKYDGYLLAVSYTHLDVYKRQPVPFTRFP